MFGADWLFPHPLPAWRQAVDLLRCDRGLYLVDRKSSLSISRLSLSRSLESTLSVNFSWVTE